METILLFLLISVVTILCLSILLIQSFTIPPISSTDSIPFRFTISFFRFTSLHLTNNSVFTWRYKFCIVKFLLSIFSSFLLLFNLAHLINVIFAPRIFSSNILLFDHSLQMSPSSLSIILLSSVLVFLRNHSSLISLFFHILQLHLFDKLFCFKGKNSVPLSLLFSTYIELFIICLSWSSRIYW